MFRSRIISTLYLSVSSLSTCNEFLSFMGSIVRPMEAMQIWNATRSVNDVFAVLLVSSIGDLTVNTILH